MLINIFLIVIITVITTSYFVRKATVKALSDSFRAIEILNEVARIEAWGRLEKIMIKVCNKEALGLIRIEQSFMFSSLNFQINNERKFINMLKKNQVFIIGVS